MFFLKPLQAGKPPSEYVLYPLEHAWLYRFEITNYNSNCYLYWSKLDNHCVLIDPGYHGEYFVQFLRERKAQLAYILLTHRHFDHICGVSPLEAAFKVPIGIHEKAKRPIRHTFSTGTLLYAHRYKLPTPKIFLKEGDRIHLGALSLSIIHTPGHTDDSVLFYDNMYGLCFTGDTLFKGFVGTTRYPSGSRKQMQSSLQKMVDVLPKKTVVYPGHGDPTTLEEELKDNVWLLKYTQTLL